MIVSLGLYLIAFLTFLPFVFCVVRVLGELGLKLLKWCNAPAGAITLRSERSNPFTKTQKLS